MSRRRKLICLVTVMAVMLACMPTIGPTPPPLPTFDANAPLTAIVETANAAAAETMMFAPPTATETATPAPTFTPTATATPTIVFILATRTITPTLIPVGSSGRPYQCQVLSQNPGNDVVIAPDTLFDAIWIVSNVGTDTWLDSEADLRYHNGARIYTSGALDLPAAVAPGANLEIIIPMKAPSDPNVYETEWRIYVGKQSFCSLKLRIVVN